MKTKQFLLATSGATVDGRVIDADWLRQMAADYDPKTYGARLNIEHIRGISGEKPFKAYGDVLELSVVENHEVTIGGTTEKRTALFGVLDVNEDAKKLNDAGQKVYPSIEVDPNFAGKGRAYLMGCALTDSPAAIGTDRLTFNRTAPGHTTISEAEDLGATLEFADEAKPADITGAIDRGFATLAKLIGAKTQEPEAKPAKPEGEQSFNATAFLAGLKDVFTSALTEQAAAADAKFGELQAELCGLKKSIEDTEQPGFSRRPAAAGAGAAAGGTKTDC